VTRSPITPKGGWRLRLKPLASRLFGLGKHGLASQPVEVGWSLLTMRSTRRSERLSRKRCAPLLRADHTQGDLRPFPCSAKDREYHCSRGGGHPRRRAHGPKVRPAAGIWFHRTYGKRQDFKPGPFIPPAEPVATTALKDEIAGLRKKNEDAAVRAKLEAEEHARATESVARRLAPRGAEEKSIWEKLAQDTEKEKAEIAARLAAVQAAAESAPKSEARDYVRRSEEASTKLDLDEAATRVLIDQQLAHAGWEADTQKLCYSAGSRPIIDPVKIS